MTTVTPMPAPAVMTLGCVGADHRRTPLELRERLAMTGDRLDALRAALQLDPAVAEYAVLSTCNRIEVYVLAPDAPLALRRSREHLFRAAGVTRAHSSVPLEAWVGVEVARHLFAVASGLESLVPGESEILRQLREAFERASGPQLGLLGRSAVTCGKRVRAETSLGRCSPGVSTVAIQSAKERLGGLRGRSAVLVGAGRVNEDSARCLQAEGIGSTVVVSRTREAAARLAARHGSHHAPLEALPSLLSAVDLAIAATRAPRPPIGVSAVAARRETRPLLLFDLGVPRDIEPAVGSLPHVELVDLDELQSTHLAPGDATSTADAWSIVEGCVRAYVSDTRIRRLSPQIGELRARLERRREDELARALAGAPADEHEALTRLAHRLTAGAFHEFVTHLKETA